VPASRTSSASSRKPLGFPVLALGFVQSRQVVEAAGHGGVFRDQGLFLDRQRPLVKGLGLGVSTLGFVELREVVEAGGSDRAFRSFSPNPVPTLPANLSFPFSLTPT
jgi:hypothetical protein